MLFKKKKKLNHLWKESALSFSPSGKYSGQRILPSKRRVEVEVGGLGCWCEGTLFADVIT